ncbi:MAG: hypothetical protein AB1801_13175 [Chloroflexota bacterium]
MEQSRQRRANLGLVIVVSTLTVLMLILLAAVIILLATNQLSADNSGRPSLLANTGPLTRVEIDQVDPALALASLGGVPEVDVIGAAVDKARPETALSAILYQPGLTDKETAGSLLLLAGAYARSGDRSKGVFSYKLAGLTAVLSPNMPDNVRADMFMQTGEGLLELAESALAKFYLDQAFMVASHSPFLPAVQRRTIFERLQKNYIILGERSLARTSLNLSANPPPLASPDLEKPMLPPNEEIVLSSLAQEAEAARWRQAQELAAILVERGGHAPQAKVQALREALIAEDRQKLPFYESELATATRLSKKIDVTVAKIEWLSTKYKVARRAYGLSLVPEWEAQVEQIRAELTKTYEMLFALYADLIVALPEVAQIDRATAERLRIEILAGELGRYPNYPEEQRQKQLLDATHQLIETQPEINIFVGVAPIAGQEMFTLTARQQQVEP